MKSILSSATTALSAILLLSTFGCSNHNVTTMINAKEQLLSVEKTEVKGKYVALSFSRAAMKVYLGRSFVSRDDALMNATASCKYSDCRVVFVNNEDGCVSFAKNDLKLWRWGKAGGATAQESETIALKYCNADSVVDDCHIVATLCPEY